jgi:hypothetical protein
MAPDEPRPASDERRSCHDVRARQEWLDATTCRRRPRSSRSRAPEPADGREKESLQEVFI